jgi:hypothetical protein
LHQKSGFPSKKILYGVFKSFEFTSFKRFERGLDMSERKRERQEVQDELIALFIKSEDIRIKRERLTKDSVDIKLADMALSKKKSREKVLNVMFRGDWKITNQDILRMFGDSYDIAIDKIYKEMKLDDGPYAIYYKDRTDFVLEVIPFDNRGDFKKQCEIMDAKEGWFQIFKAE